MSVFKPSKNRLMHQEGVGERVVCFGVAQDDLYVLDATGRVQMLSLINFKVVDSWQAVQGEV